VHQAYVGLAFCTPIPEVRTAEGNVRLASVSTEWHRARRGLMTPTNFALVDVNVDGMEIGDARQKAIEIVMEMPNRAEFLFFLDYDVVPAYDALEKLLIRARHYPDHDIFSGVYVSKSLPAEPLIYEEDGAGPFWDWQIGDLLIDKIHGCHMGLTLIRTALFDRFPKSAWDTPLFLTVNQMEIGAGGMPNLRRGTEDLYFCARAVKEAGARFIVDTSVLAAHQDYKTGILHGLDDLAKPGRTRWLYEPSATEFRAEKKALDLGAGRTRRKWPGLVTYTTDIRDDVGADFVMDSRKVNLPDDTFDLIASSHHYEHIPRWEQDELWRETFRLCKPDGRIEIIVPSLDWAAAKIIDGETDEHVFNVLYGAQEAHNYRREWNLHFFGYTRDVARDLAEEAGFVDVETRDFQDDPGLGYNLYILGRKPRPDEKPGEADAGNNLGTDRAGGWSLNRLEPLHGRAALAGRLARRATGASRASAGNSFRTAKHPSPLHRGDRHRRGAQRRRVQVVRAGNRLEPVAD
jgi:predicted SAM-dependent methyltransferase